MLVNKSGKPIEFYLTPGSYNDANVLQSFCFELPSESIVYGDKAYNRGFTKIITKFHVETRKKN